MEGSSSLQTAIVSVNPAMTSFVSSLYWSLPTPRSFVERVQSHAKACRATVLSFRRHLMPGTWDGVKEGLRAADVLYKEISIGDGTDIALEIAPHLECSAATPLVLAQLRANHLVAVLLRPRSEMARQRCDDYFAHFLREVEHSAGSVHLFIEMRDGEQRLDAKGRDVQVLTFDGALSPDEMAAYVGIRMLGREGPGSTRLLRALVYEYAGFDARLAERLIALTDSEILSLPGSLGPLLEEEPLRWSASSWAHGTHATIDGHEARHPLHEWHLALHKGHFQDEARRASQKRYWRASVQALTPWLEERRGSVLEVFKKPIDEVLAVTGGKIQKVLQSGKTVEIDRSEIDYNTLVGFAHYQGLRIPFDPISQRAFGVCKLAKCVRDDLAHLRAPKLQDISSLISETDGLLDDIAEKRQFRSWSEPSK